MICRLKMLSVEYMRYPKRTRLHCFGIVFYGTLFYLYVKTTVLTSLSRRAPIGQIAPAMENGAILLQTLSFTSIREKLNLFCSMKSMYCDLRPINSIPEKPSFWQTKVPNRLPFSCVMDAALDLRKDCTCLYKILNPNQMYTVNESYP